MDPRLEIRGLEELMNADISCQNKVDVSNQFIDQKKNLKKMVPKFLIEENKVELNGINNVELDLNRDPGLIFSIQVDYCECQIKLNFTTDLEMLFKIQPLKPNETTL